MSPLNNLQNDIFVQTLAEHIMKSTLKIKHFGPIKEVDLVLKNVNVSNGFYTKKHIYIALFHQPSKYSFLYF